MWIKIVNRKDEHGYRGFDRCFPKWELKRGMSIEETKDLCRYYEMDLDVDDVIDLFDEYVALYRKFRLIYRDIEMIIVSEEPIEDEKLCFLGYDVGDMAEGSFLRGEQSLHYDFLNDNWLIKDKKSAEALLKKHYYDDCEPGEHNHMYYVYSYLDDIEVQFAGERKWDKMRVRIEWIKDFWDWLKDDLSHR